MPGIKQLKREVRGNSKERALAALFLLLVTLDCYSLIKQDNVRLTAYLGVFKKEFVEQSEFELTQKLGDWLVSLPKGVWNK